MDDNCDGVKDETFMTISVQGMAEEERIALRVKAVPNPSDHYFNLNIQSSSEKTVRIRVFNVLGYLVEERSGVTPGCTVQLGGSYRVGVYTVEVVQGSERCIVKLVKQ